MSARDLTGRWDGIFNYPHTLPPTGFVATLVELRGALTGEVEEPDDGGAALAAVVEGERIGSRVRFTKRYDALARAHYAVAYEGTLTPDGDEIVGEWTIPGIWSGSFIMVRAAGRAAAVEQVARATAPADGREEGIP